MGINVQRKRSRSRQEINGCSETYRNVEQRVDVLESECLGGECICGCSGIWDDADIDILSIVTVGKSQQKRKNAESSSHQRGESSSREWPKHYGTH